MDHLLPHYERELAFLRGRSAEFARQYPKIAGRLMLTGDVGDDPHVERLMEAFAFLSARIHKRLDDDFPQVTEGLLEALYPHYLRPFPSCSVAQLSLGPAAGQMTQAAVVPRGTVLTARPVQGVACRFTTTRDVCMLPVRLADAVYRGAVRAPSGTALPPAGSSCLSLTLDKLSPQMGWSAVFEQPLVFYIDGESSQVRVLREALMRRCVAVFAQLSEHGFWQRIDLDAHGRLLRPRLCGLDDDEALLHWNDRSHPAYRLLTEYFAFPEKFNVLEWPVSWPLTAVVPGTPEAGGHQDQVRLHVVLQGVRQDSDEARLLETVQAHNLVLGVTPVVNLFRQAADPIKVTQRTSTYPLVVDARRAYAYDVHAVDRVYRVQQSEHGERVDEVRPFFSLNHDDLWAAESGEALPRSRSGMGYWQLHRDDDLAQSSPGHECLMTLVDADLNERLPDAETLSIDVWATNRDLPTALSVGNSGGDLFMEGGGLAHRIQLLKRPTSTMRFERGRGVLWRLISQLSLNHLTLSGAGLEGFKEMLRLYDLPRSAINQRLIDGVVGIDFRPATAWLPGQPFATCVKGTEVRLTVQDEAFVGHGLGLFAAVLERFFALYVHINSFSQLTLVSAESSEVILSCPPRNGDTPLV